MTDMGMVPPLERLLSTGFFQFSSARSYTATGSFVRFLLDRYGAAPLRELYRSGGDFTAAYGRHRDELVREWRAMVDSIELPATSREKVRERFRRGGIFERPCPHAVADKLTRLGDLVRRGELEEAIDVARVLCDDVPDEPSHRMELAELLFRNDDHDEARAIYHHMVEEKAGLSTTIRAEAYLSLAQLAAAIDDRAGVAAALDKAGELPTDDDQARQVVARRIANDHAGPAGPALRHYFWPPDPNAPADPTAHLGLAAAAAVAEPQLALAHYLVGRNLGGRGVAAEAATALRRAMDLGLGHPLLVREGAQLLAAESYLSGDLATVERAAAILTADDQPEVTRLLGFDWLERVHWKRHGRLPPRPLGPVTTPPAIQAAAPRR
jgi:tetratricopeptide (TPR) repeat protein